MAPPSGAVATMVWAELRRGDADAAARCHVWWRLLVLTLRAPVPTPHHLFPPLQFGVFHGLGAAFAYISVTSCLQRWFCELKGLATGE